MGQGETSLRILLWAEDIFCSETQSDYLDRIFL
jgi:hypothetical protein